MNPNEITVILACRHSFVLRQSIKRIGERVYCDECGGTRVVVEVEGVWSWRCSVCRAGRTHGVIRWQADKAATRHAQQRGHVVNLWRRGYADTVTKIRPENDVEPLPF